MTDKIFGNPIRLKLLKLFIFNPQCVFDIKTISKKVQAIIPAVKKEIKVLVAGKLIKQKQTIDTKGKKVKGFGLDTNFKHIEAFRDFLMKVSPLSDINISEKINRAGKVKLTALSGVFMNNSECRVDLLVVGDKINKNILNRAILNIESELGSELKYAFFETPDFEYRRAMGDKLVRDILEYPHKIIFDRLGISG